MKILILPLVALVLFTLASCSEDFNTAAPYRNITVVSGLLDVNDTAHYIRIQKAFMDQNKSALTMAKVPDSNFYQSLDVKIKVMSGSSVQKIITLQKVDLNAEGYPKDSGAFFTSPSYAYKFKDRLDAGYTYRLVITNSATGETDSAESGVIDPSGFNVSLFQYSNYPLDIESTSPNSAFRLGGTGPANSVLFEGIMRFNYMDSDLITGAETPRYADFSIGTLYSGSPTFNFTVNNIDIYSGIRTSIGLPPSSNIVRMMGGVNIILYTATQDFYTYQLVTQTLSSGLTGNDIHPTYTNIKGANVLGLFAARTSIVDTGIRLTVPSIDSLMINPITSPVQIRGLTVH